MFSGHGAHANQCVLHRTCTVHGPSRGGGKCQLVAGKLPRVSRDKCGDLARTGCECGKASSPSGQCRHGHAQWQGREREAFTRGRAAWLPGCLGSTSDPVTDDFSVESTFNGLSFTGLGDCRVLKADGPGRGIASWRRTLHRTGLPAPYTGGLLVSNTLARQAPNGPQTQPPGHTQSSIATVRPWRVPWRAARG